MDLSDKIVVITGASRGLGAGFAEVIAEQGAQVIICSRTKSVHDERHKIVSAGNACESFVVDVTNAKQVSSFIEKIVKKYGRIDVLINNAGALHEKKPVEEISHSEFNETMQTNVAGIFYFLHEVVPIMKDQNSGTIVNISSGAGKHGHPGASVYAASKFAVQGITESVAKELEETNIKCIALCPGGVNTAMRKKYAQDDEQQQSVEVVANILLDVITGKIKIPNGGDVSIRNGKVGEIRDNLSS